MTIGIFVNCSSTRLAIDHSKKKDGGMYIVPKCIAGINIWRENVTKSIASG
jgi:hypothetical protein